MASKQKCNKFRVSKLYSFMVYYTYVSLCRFECWDKFRICEIVGTEFFRVLCYYAALSWFETDVSRIPTAPISKGRAFKMGLIGSLETSIWIHLTPRSNPEQGIIQIQYTFMCQILGKTTTCCDPFYSKLLSKKKSSYYRTVKCYDIPLLSPL